MAVCETLQTLFTRIRSGSSMSPKIFLGRISHHARQPFPHSSTTARHTQHLRSSVQPIAYVLSMYTSIHRIIPDVRLSNIQQRSMPILPTYLLRDDGGETTEKVGLAVNDDGLRRESGHLSDADRVNFGKGERLKYDDRLVGRRKSKSAFVVPIFQSFQLDFAICIS